MRILSATRHDPTRAAGLVLSVVAIVALIVFGASVRSAEALSLKWLLTPLTHTLSVGDTVVVGTDTVRPLALRVTPECTAAVLVIPCIVAFALFTLFRNVRMTRAVGALLLVVGMVFALNQLRIALVAAAYTSWGASGIWAAHSVLGTLISFAAILLGLAVQTRMTAGHARVARQVQ